MSAPAGPHAFSEPQMDEDRTEFVILIRQRLGGNEWFHASSHDNYATTRESAEEWLAREIAKTDAEVARIERVIADLPAHEADDIAFMTKERDRVRGTEHAIFARTVSKYTAA